MSAKTHLTDADRFQIEVMLKNRYPLNRIAEQVGKAKSTIAREIKKRAAESEKFAAQLYNDILDEMEWLIAFPQMAPAEPMLDQEPETFRSLVVRRRYKVVYSIAGETVTIADVWDCRMDPEVLKKRTAKRK